MNTLGTYPIPQILEFKDYMYLRENSPSIKKPISDHFYIGSKTKKSCEEIRNNNRRSHRVMRGTNQTRAKSAINGTSNEFYEFSADYEGKINGKGL